MQSYRDENSDRYGIERWGQDYFSINDQGEVCVTCLGESKDQHYSLNEIIKQLEVRGFETPVLLRFSAIIEKRLDEIYAAFKQTISEYDYKGSFRGVYPIKVNQQAQVLEAICSYGARYDHGLEAGSKAELLLAVSLSRLEEGLIITNGYKDAEFIDIGLNAKKMGINCIFVVESPTEIPLIIERSKALGIEPEIGIRFKLSSSAGGHWKESAGDRSVFGLSTTQLMDALAKLKQAGMIHCVTMLHYHLGSQLPDIADIRRSVVEAARVYVGMHEEGAPMGKIDFGGGLAVDYTGNHSHTHMSMNYSIYEYSCAIIEVLSQILNEKGLEHPQIITESGRSTIAYCSVLIFNILDTSHLHKPDVELGEIREHAPEALKNIYLVENYLEPKRLQECYHDILHYREDIRQQFKMGRATLRDKAQAEKKFWDILSQIRAMAKTLEEIPEELEQLDQEFLSIYYGNFSLFQSLPDSWAIDHLFPVMPLHRLNEAPTEDVIISDITCDCDGVITSFVQYNEITPSLKLHELKDDAPYYLGVFLVGAYQETLGDLHNLFGDTHTISVSLDAQGNLDFSRENEGDTVSDVLSYVEHDPKDLVRKFRVLVDRAVALNKINPKESRHIVDAFQQGLNGYTYHEV